MPVFGVQGGWQLALPPINMLMAGMQAGLQHGSDCEDGDFISTGSRRRDCVDLHK